ncbi:MAG: hypothetical protein Q7S84_01470 [bacterium]|nr:hypothetical protein [bacterium]
MHESPNEKTKELFIVPDVSRERGEIERVAVEVFGAQDTGEFFSRFLEAAKTAPLVELSEDIWSRLENTDSYDIPPKDWPLVKEHAVEGHPDHPRDWRFYKTRYEQGGPIEVPIIVKKGDAFHLVSGNTRLMVARAMGKVPKVLIVETDAS